MCRKKVINGKQFTIVWYFNDNKLYHVNPSVVTEILEVIKKHFGELVISRGDEHYFLGIQITLRKEKIVELIITGKLWENIEIFGSTCGYAVITPGGSHLWELN